MRYLCAALILALATGRIEAVLAKETCSGTWNRGGFKTFRQIQDELHGQGKILKLSLCGSANEHYFEVTVLDPSGKVRTLRLAAR